MKYLYPPLIYCHGELVGTEHGPGGWFCRGCGQKVSVVW